MSSRWDDGAPERGPRPSFEDVFNITALEAVAWIMFALLSGVACYVLAVLFG